MLSLSAQQTAGTRCVWPASVPTGRADAWDGPASATRCRFPGGSWPKDSSTLQRLMAASHPDTQNLSP